MTEKNIDSLARKIAHNVLKAFTEYYDNHETLEIYRPSEKEAIEMELERLNGLLSRYEDKEEYEKAAIIKRKIEIINKKYKK
jgi:protein-arginine kinase activator protein McsA|tara:strand:- start:33 stop:278 length:246 start_codon:yes stop_codon:yes gene_type:complete